MQDVTGSVRCLAILGKLTGWDLLAQVWPVLLPMARLVAAFRRGPRSREAMFIFETELQTLLREMGRRIVQWTINHLEPEDRHRMPGQSIWEGEYYRLRYRSPLRNLNCLFGPITLRRFCYQPLEMCGRCLFPLQIQLGIVAGVATPALADLVARISADMTQRQVLDQLRHRGVHWGVRSLRKVTQVMAEMMSDCRHQAQVEELLKWLKIAASSTGPRRFTLSVGRDGVMIPIVKSDTYKEAAAATVSVLDRWGRRIGTVYLGQMPQPGQSTLSEQLTRLLTDVLTSWDGLMARLIYVTDCGSHPTEYFEQVLSRMHHPHRPGELLAWEWIVDYYHACLYITKLAEAIFGPGRQAFAWAAKQCKVLKEKPGGCFRVLRSAGALLGIADLDKHRAGRTSLGRCRPGDLRDLHYQFQEGEELFVRGWSGNRETAQIVVNTGSRYDIGFRRQTQEYEVVADWWGVEGNTHIRQQDFIQQVSRQYSYNIIRSQAREQNLIIEEEQTLENGDVVILLSERG